MENTKSFSEIIKILNQNPNANFVISYKNKNNKIETIGPFNLNLIKNNFNFFKGPKLKNVISIDII